MRILWLGILEVIFYKGHSMTLTLTDEEVIEYMNMREHITNLNNYIKDLQEQLTIVLSTEDE